MALRRLILASAIFIGLVGTATAQSPDLLDGSNVAEILELAQGYGDAQLEEVEGANPKIRGEMDGITYVIFFMNCTDNRDCEDLNFYAGFTDLEPEMELINAWNRDKRFAKAYLDNEEDAVVEMDLNLEHGVSRDNLDAALAVWKLVLEQYVDYFGYKRP